MRANPLEQEAFETITGGTHESTPWRHVKDTMELMQMSIIVGVHGIGQQLKGKRLLLEAWQPALRDGVGRVNPQLAEQIDLAIAFYGDIFRRSGSKTLGDVPYDASDVDDPMERELLETWWHELVRMEQVPGPGAQTKARTPQSVQRALNVLSSSRFFAGIAERMLIADLKQVRLFLRDPDIKRRILDRVTTAVGLDTRVIIGHSLGSVVAYEALCANPDWPVHTLVTLGSPLGIARLVFDRLVPPPVNNTGIWPISLKSWTNVADGGDAVALIKTLSTRFGPRVRDKLIYNGATAHDVIPYLTAKETGEGIAHGLSA